MRPAKRQRRGSELVELALVTTFLLPILYGLVVIGLNLGRSIQTSQLSRDAGHMYARSVDFANVNNQKLLERLAVGLDIKRGGGRGVIILSKVMFAARPQCDAANLPGTSCKNENQPVIVHRVVIGNAAASPSAFGTPDAGLVGADGKVSNYLTELSARANGFNSVLQLQPGEEAYVSEVFVPSTDYGLPKYVDRGVYARGIF
jgi:hypothetical protein